MAIRWDPVIHFLHIGTGATPRRIPDGAVQQDGKVCRRVYGVSLQLYTSDEVFI